MLLGVIKKYHLNISLSLLSFFVILPFLILVALTESPDTNAYRLFLTHVDYNLFNMYGTEFAIGFQLFTKMIKFVFGDSYFLYIFILTSVNCLLIIEIIKLISQQICCGDNNKKKHFDHVLALVMYFSYFGLYYNSIAIRANYTLTIIYLITAIYINRNITLRLILLTIFMLIVSSLFHKTAILGILVLIVFYFSHQYSKKTYILLWIGTGCIYFFGLSKIFVHWFLETNMLNKLLNIMNSDGLREIVRYSTFVNIENSISYKFIFQYLVAFLLIFPKKQIKFYYQYLNVYFMGIIIGGFFGSMGTITRIQDFFTFSLFILSWLFIRELKIAWFTVVLSIIIVIPQLIFVIRIINNY